MKAFYIEPPRREMDSFSYNLMRSWHKTLSRYEEKWKQTWKKQLRKDLPYIYNEEAQTGLLALAAERIGGFPFLEFDQDKRSGSGKGKQDLEIITDNQVWSIEAKFLSVRFDDHNLETMIREKVNDAVHDVRQLIHRKAGINMGIVFVAPYGVSGDADCESFARRIIKLTRWLKDGLCAIHFCKKEIWPLSDHKDSPGVAIIGRLVT